MGRPDREVNERAVVSSTLSGASIARAVEALFPLGTVAACHVARRGFNHVYEFQVEGGQRDVARLSSARPRGEANIEFESALLLHLKRAGAAVAAPLLARDGRAFAYVGAAEGERALMVTEFLHGFQAIALFVPIRHIWLLGERAGRINECGSQSLPTSWLQKQLEWLRAWESFETPGEAGGAVNAV